MSTFGGVIEEIPGISVDRFEGDNINSSVFFLSHCHTDHMEGLSFNFFQHLHDKHRYLYCTPISKEILKNINKLNDNLLNIIKTIDGCAPIIINYCKDNQTLYLTVTAIPAGHCPGSVMFIFENTENRILYTGDFRIDANDFSKIKPLHNNINGKMVPKKFDTIYLDTTFFNWDPKYFPSRQEALREICKVIHDWISQNDKKIVILECSGNYGAEHLFIELSRALGVRIHVKDNVFNSYTFIPELADCVSNDPHACQIHACVYKRPRCNAMLCRSDVLPELIITVVPSVMIWKGEDLSKRIYKWDEYSKRFYVCYSCHSSHDELETFIKYFRPDKIYPCVCRKNVSFEDLQNQLNEILKTSVTNKSSNYNLNLSRYKSPSEVKSMSNLSDDD